MTRREAVGAALGSLGAGASARPNLLLILADDLGWADLGCYGADLHETPHLDRLARSGVRFTQAYAASPVCTPTRASLLTGQHPARLGMTIWREAAKNTVRNRKLLPPDAAADLPRATPTLAELLGQRGYLTGLIGKWHLGDAGHGPEARGFAVNIGGTHWGAPQSFFYPYTGTRYYGGEFRYVPGLPYGREGEYLTDRLTMEAERFIDAARVAEKPFFLFLSHHAPHTPIEGKPALVAKYRAKLRAGLRHRNAAYAAMVESLDESVGRVLGHLERRGLAKNTAVVFVSDNGGAVQEWEGETITNNAPLRSGKGSVYEGGVRVPMLVRAPGWQAAERDDLVTTMDVFRTLAEWGGAEAKTGIDGRNLKGGGQRDELFFHYPHYYPTTTPVSAVRQGDWKLVEYYEDGRRELYELRGDLGETRDLAAREPERVARLARRLEEWRREVKAPMPQANPGYRGV